MYRNWYLISKQSISDHKMYRMFHPTNIELYLQKIYLLKMLLEQESDEKKCWMSFRDICCDTELDKKLLDNDQESFVRLAKKQNWREQRKVEFYISQKEVDFINSIDAPREFRLFILGILIYAKYIKQQIGIPMVGTRERSYAYFLTSGIDEFNVGRQRSKYINTLLSEKKKQHGIIFYPCSTKIKSGDAHIPKTVISIKGKWIKWDADSGFLIQNLEKDALELAKEIKDQEFVCSNCGKKYFGSNKTKTDLCPDCYAENRKKKQAEWVKNKRKKQGVDSNHPNIS